MDVSNPFSSLPFHFYDITSLQCAHAFWSSNGFLSNTATDPLWSSGAIDLAGSGPVHMTGGVTALVAAIILGPRRGRFYDDDGNPLEEPNEIAPHSVTLQFLGTFCLWFGWYVQVLSFGNLIYFESLDFRETPYIVFFFLTHLSFLSSLTVY